MAGAIAKVRDHVKNAVPLPSINRSPSIPDGLDKWFDDMSIEEDKTDIRTPNANRDPGLAKLVNEVNAGPSASREAQQHNIDMLGRYLNDLKKSVNAQKSEKKRHRFRTVFSHFTNFTKDQSKSKETEKKRDGSTPGKHDGLSQALRKEKEEDKPLTKKQIDSVVDVLVKGVKVVKPLAFLASEVTCGTHLQVALNSIMLFVTVSWTQTSGADSFSKY
ncbi:hypothetical protein Daus18300_013719 [Diaporthe australafricana]|uniref:Uncharacterized protein n=1 Tax=Diaporthe australafricana TaxID=127596 RepID=A0ABR3VXZ6_9PEZI